MLVLSVFWIKFVLLEKRRCEGHGGARSSNKSIFVRTVWSVNSFEFCMRVTLILLTVIFLLQSSVPSYFLPLLHYNKSQPKSKQGRGICLREGGFKPSPLFYKEPNVLPVSRLSRRTCRRAGRGRRQAPVAWKDEASPAP